MKQYLLLLLSLVLLAGCQKDDPVMPTDPLPDDVVKDQISAKVEDGILTVTMPKTEPKQKVTKAIEVS